MSNNQIEKFVVICDETNNSQESLNQGYLFADIYMPIPFYYLNFTVNKDGTIEFDNPISGISNECN